MRILLLRVPLKSPITADMSDMFEKDVGVCLPLGLLYLHSSLRQVRPGDDIRVLDCMAEGLGIEEALNEVASFNPRVIGLTVLTFHLVDVYRFIATIKERLPDSAIVLGGPHVHLFPEVTMENLNVDYVITGEGEISFPMLLDAMERRASTYDIPGLFYRSSAGEVRGTPPILIKDLDSLAPIDFTAVKPNRYKSVMEKELFVMLMSSRGCPYKCIYCDRPHLGNVFRSHSPNRVIGDIKRALECGISNFQFFDDTFTVVKSRVEDICRMIIEQKLNIKFSLRARVNTVDEGLLASLKNAGCRRISFGVEAGSNRMLRSLKKNITTDEITRTFYLCKKIGIETLADFIVGGPDQKRKDVEETIDFALKIDPTYAQFTIMTPYPGTELYQMGMDRGVIKTDYWKDFALNPSEDFNTPMWEEHLKRDELLELFNHAYRKFYRRPRYILREFLKVRSFMEFYRKARIGLKVIS